MRNSKYQGVLTDATFPSLAQDDHVGQAAAHVMVEGMPISEAASMYAVNANAVRMRCQRIAESSRLARMGVYRRGMYALINEALSFAPSAWHDRAVEIIDNVEDKK